MGILKTLTRILRMNQSHLRILVIGLDNSGKTTIINYLKPRKTQLTEVVPTIGFQVEQFSKENLHFTVFDMSGQSRYRRLWETYYLDVQALIYVIDATDTLRMCVVKDELEQLLAHKAISDRKIPILFFANKMDMPHAATTVECMEKLDLHKLEGRSWHMIASNAISGSGIEEGIAWLAQHLAGRTQSG